MNPPPPESTSPPPLPDAPRLPVAGLPEGVRIRALRAVYGDPRAAAELLPRLTERQAAGLDPLPTEPGDLAPALLRVHRREIRTLPDDTRLLLLLAAADQYPVPTHAFLRAVTAARLDTRPLAAAEAAGVAHTATGGVVFRDAWARVAAYETAEPADRRDAHRLLARVLSGAREAPSRSWHRGAGALGPSGRLAVELDAAAVQARAAGRPALARALVERAAALSPEPGEQARLLARAAADAWHCGEADRARRLTAATADDALTGILALRTGNAFEAFDALLRAAARQGYDGACAAGDAGGAAGGDSACAAGGDGGGATRGDGGGATGDEPAPAGPAARRRPRHTGDGPVPSTPPVGVPASSGGLSAASGGLSGSSGGSSAAAGASAVSVNGGSTAGGAATPSGGGPSAVGDTPQASSGDALAPSGGVLGPVGGVLGPAGGCEAGVAGVRGMVRDAGTGVRASAGRRRGADPADDARAGTRRATAGPSVSGSRLPADLPVRLLLVRATEAAVYTGDLRRCREAVQVAVRSGVGVPGVLAGITAAADGRYEVARDHLERAAGRRGPGIGREGGGRTDGGGDPTLLVHAGIAALMLGDHARAATATVRAVDSARVQGATATAAQAMEFRAYADFWTGRPRAAEAATAHALHQAYATGQDNGACHLQAALAMFAAITGDGDLCRERAAAARGYALAHGLGLPAALAQWALAFLDVVTGRFDTAATRLRALAGFGPGHGHRAVRHLATPHYVEAAVRTGDTRVARTAHADYHRWASAVRSADDLALSARCRALLTPGAGAVEHYRTALDLHAHGTRDFERARTEMLFGSALRRLRRRAEARDRLHGALAAFESFGAPHCADQARTELRALGTPASPARGLDDPTARLTAQQLLVARMAAEGATNREIAARLALSPRTIDHHLRGVFTRLGIRSRIELVRLLAEGGSPPG
ncbi:helix-turn-helix transcriptional regulator [Streptomyces adustus]